MVTESKLPVTTQFSCDIPEGISDERICHMSSDAPQAIAVKSAASMKIGIVAARYNPELVDALIENARAHLLSQGVKEKSITLARVPGSNELPVAAQWMARKKTARPDVIIALGVVIRGGTIHYELVSQSATEGLQRVALDEGIPVICGVVVAENRKQALERSKGKTNRGAEFAQAALEMAALKKQFSK